jgi:nitrate/nitrite-specific signal transduction histidine kinase
MEHSEESPLMKQIKEFLDVFKKGEEFAQDLLKENERLRYKMVNLEEQVRGLQKGDVKDLLIIKNELDQLREENRLLKDRYREVEAENRDFASRFVEVEEENNNLANLYVASYQLHSTLDFKEVVRTIIEIVINLIGADKFAILIRDEMTEDLQVVVSEGMDEKLFKKLRRIDGTIGDVIKTGESYFEPDISQAAEPSELHPVVCIPLRIKDKVFGVLAVFSLLEQKKRKLTRVDHELFTMLAGHAATALFSSMLYSKSERKLSAIQGFLDLLSGKERQRA